MLPFHNFKERCNVKFRLQEAKTHSRCLLNASWLRRYQGSARPEKSDGVTVELGAPVEEGAALGEARGAQLGGAGGDELVLLGGHHGQVQALLDGPAAGGVAVQAVSDGGDDLVGAFRGPGKKASGHATFTPVGELVLANSHLIRHAGS